MKIHERSDKWCKTPQKTMVIWGHSHLSCTSHDESSFRIRAHEQIKKRQKSLPKVRRITEGMMARRGAKSSRLAAAPPLWPHTDTHTASEMERNDTLMRKKQGRDLPLGHCLEGEWGNTLVARGCKEQEEQGSASRRAGGARGKQSVNMAANISSCTNYYTHFWPERISKIFEFTIRGTTRLEI